MDLRIDGRLTIGRAWVTTFFSVQNVYSRDNVSHYAWNVKTQRLEAQSQIGFLPVGGINVAF